jgi:DNA-binding CsgD family transcriptional regulator
MNTRLTPQQQQVLALLGVGLSRDAIARRLGMNEHTFDRHRRQLLQAFEIRSTGELRASAKGLKIAPLGHRGQAKELSFGRRHLPNLILSQRKPIGVKCRARFGARSLRDVADYICDCQSSSAGTADDLNSLLSDDTGTMGAKQALLAMLAYECGCGHLELIVACCELRLPNSIEGPAGTCKQTASTLPLAVCWLRYKGRRLQIGDSNAQAPIIVNPITELRIEPAQLPAERAALYKKCAADWCQALDMAPREFACLRAAVLRATMGKALFEDLLGFGIDPDYEPR